MTTFDTGTVMGSITDHVAGQKIKEIIKKYLSAAINEELCNNIMKDLKDEFGDEHPAQVNLDDETGEIEVIVLDANGRYIKCSSLTLFPKGE